MSLAAETRTAVRSHPFLYDALRAGVLNYTATARFLDLGDVETVTAALRRYATELDDINEGTDQDVRVSMQSGLGPVSDTEDALLRIGDTAYGTGGSLTGIIARGTVAPALLGAVLDRFRIEDISVEIAAVCSESLMVLVDRRDGPHALRIVEVSLE